MEDGKRLPPRRQLPLIAGAVALAVCGVELVRLALLKLLMLPVLLGAFGAMVRLNRPAGPLAA